MADAAELSAMIMYIKPLALTSKSLALVIWGVGLCEIMLTSCLCIPLTNLQLSGTHLEDQPCSKHKIQAWLSTPSPRTQQAQDAAEQHVALKEQLSDIKSDNATLVKSRQDLLKRLEQCVDLKESDLLSKFVMHLCMHVHSCLCTLVHPCMCVHSCLCTLVHLCMCVHSCLCTLVHLCMCVHCTLVHLCMCIHSCLCTLIIMCTDVVMHVSCMLSMTSPIMIVVAH